MGGYVAFELFRCAAQQLTGMAFISTSARADTPEAIAGREKMLAIVESDYAKAVALTLNFAPHPACVDDEIFQAALRAVFEGVSPQEMAQQLRTIMVRPDSRPLLAEIAVPTLVASGVDDIVISPDRSEEIAQTIANATLVWLPECGHISPMEQPDALAQAMRSWLDAVAKSPHFKD
jgi:pimeloyl-ACP methyl ester carboxylesterase